MKPFIIAAIVLLVIVVLTACVRKPTVETAEEVTYDPAVQRQIADDSLSFLKTRIADSASFSEITDAFAELCAAPTADDEILFEAGTYTFTGEPMFTVSLARQIPDGADEFYQIRAELSFRPDTENAGIEELKWLDPTDEDALAAVRQSAAFAYAETHTAVSVDLRIDET